MDRYRIKIGSGYDGCIPITVYWVEVRECGLFGYKWRKIKGFDSKERAIELLNMLNGR
jgi:hypothetical protein